MNSTTAKHKASASQSIRRNNGGTFANAGVWTGGGGGAVCADGDEAGVRGAAFDHAVSDFAGGVPGGMAAGGNERRGAGGVADGGAVGEAGVQQCAPEDFGFVAG